MIEDRKTIFIIAGEESGDSHAAELIKNITAINNNIKFSGIGGDNLRNAGAELIFNYREINFFGFLSVIRNIFYLKKIFNTTVNYIKSLNPELIILVDFPGFNLRIAKKLKKFYKGKIIYYISPQIWAWHKSRIKIIRKTVDKMLVIFPFEVDFYKRENVEAVFTGHPLKERISGFLATHTKQKSEKYTITLLPGSRIEEIHKIFPILIEAAVKFKKIIDCEIIVVCARNIEPELIKSLTDFRDFKIIKNDNQSNEPGYQTIYNSDIVFAKSGTSTLECCLLGTPFCVVYKMNYLNYLISRFFIKIKYISIINILADKAIVKEFIQRDFNPENLITEGRRLLTDKNYRTEMLNNFDKIRNDLFNVEGLKNTGEIIIGMLK